MEFLALVIEPDTDLRRLIREVLEEDGWQVVEVCAVDDALTVISHRQDWPLVFCTTNPAIVESNEHASLNILRLLREHLGAAAYIVMMGADNSPSAALNAILDGASDFMGRPCAPDDIRKRSLFVKQRLHAASQESTQPSLSIHPYTLENNKSAPELIGSSEAIIRVFKKVAQSLTQHFSSGNKSTGKKDAGRRAPSYFITGETGTGKELVAQLIHRRGSYAGGAFVPINCSALPVDLAESELFGYEPGAFTGAVKEKKGLWETAHGGTLFLDEITEAPRAILPKLLRVLQERTIKRLGSNHLIPVDVQVIAASNRDLKTEIQAGRFREDLYHRLSLFQFHLPPLRERREDIPLLVSHFARRYAVQPTQFSRDAVDLLTQYSWPGNVRELENLVRAAVAHAGDGMVYAIDLLPRLQTTREVELACDQCNSNAEIDSEIIIPRASRSLEAQVKEFKLKTVKEALRQHRGNITHTAAALGMTRPTLYKLLKEANSEER